MSYHGDIRLGDTIDIKFTTRRFSTGAPHTLAGSPAVAAYVGNGTTEITAGITLTVDFDGRTGLNNARIVASGGNGFAAATNVQLVITAGTVDSVSVVGEVVAEFSIENRSAVMPTTAGRTLDVSAGGEAGLDWANIGSPTTTVNLSGTTIGTSTNLTNLPSIPANWLTAAGTASDFGTEMRTVLHGGDWAADMDANGRIRIVDGTGTGEIDTSSGRVQLTEAQIDQIVDEVWDELLAGHATANTTGDALNLIYGGTVAANVTEINGSDTAAAKFEKYLSTWISGTADSGTTTTAVDAALTEADTDYYKGWTFLPTSGDLLGQGRLVTAFTPGTDTLTLSHATTQAVGTHDYLLIPGVRTDLGLLAGGAQSAADLKDFADDGYDPATNKVEGVKLVDTLTTYTGDTPQTGDAYAIVNNGTHGNAALKALIDTVDNFIDTEIADIQSRLPAALVSGRMDSSVGAMAADSITSSATHSSYLTELRTSLNGGDWATSQDSNGRVRIVDGTGAGELDTTSGGVLVSTLAAQAKSDVNAELLDVMATDTHAQPGQGTPPATATFEQMLAYTYKALRNQKKQSDSEYQLFNDDASTVDQKATVSEVAGVLTFGELVTGP